MSKRKDSENFPQLDDKATEKDIIDPSKEILLETLVKVAPKPKKIPSEESPKLESKVEKTCSEKVETKIKEPVEIKKKEILITKRIEVLNYFEELQKDLVPGEGLTNNKSLVILQLTAKSCLEEFEPTMPRKINRFKHKNRKHSKRVPKKNKEIISLTKGKNK